MGDCQPSAVIFVQAMPLAPKVATNGVMSSKSLRDMSPPLGNADAFDHAAFFDRAGENLGLAVAQRVGEIADLQAEAHVGLVRAEAVHRLFVGQASETAA